MVYDISQRNSVVRPHLVAPNNKSGYFDHFQPEIHLPKDYVLYRAGDIPQYCYYLKKGLIVSFEYTKSGEEYFYNMNADGALVFDGSTILQTTLGVDFKTLVPSTVVKISRDSLLEAIETNPTVAFDVICSAQERFENANEQLRELSIHSAYWKLCNMLLTLARKYGVPYEGKVLIDLKVSQQTLANMLRINRITVTRAVKDLQESGQLEIINRHYCIRDLKKLSEHADAVEAKLFGKK